MSHCVLYPTVLLNGSVLPSTGTNNANYVAMENGNIPLRIGADAGGYGPFKGTIDEVHIYSGVLTQEEIQQVYAEGL